MRSAHRWRATNSASRSRILVGALAGCAHATPASAQWAPDYAIDRIGLYGTEYTDSFGWYSNIVSDINPAGQAIGYVERVAPDDSILGTDVWTWDGQATHQIGLLDAEHMSNAGFRRSEALFINPSGQVVGHSYRFTEDGNSHGEDAWVWDGSTTLQIGFTGPDYTDTQGYQESYIAFQNDAGLVAGYSARVVDTAHVVGVDAWVWNHAQPQQIGLIDPAHTDQNGSRWSSIIALSQTGQVAGLSDRFDDQGMDNGRSAWAFRTSTGTTEPIGLFAGPYIGSAGYQYSWPLAQNNAGHIVGKSVRIADERTQLGQDSWVWHDGATNQIGLVGAPYLSPSGFQASDPIFLNATGQVVGTSMRCSSTAFLGHDAWVWNGSTTIQVGLIDAAHTSSAGYRDSGPALQNDAGQVVGVSDRFSGATQIGEDAWVWNGAATQQIGLADAAHTAGSGQRHVAIRFQNDAGHVAGYSSRYTGLNSDNGVDAWAWDGVATHQIGLAGGPYTGVSGFQSSEPFLQNSMGHIAGASSRITGISTTNGQDAWAWDGVVTRQIGLLTPPYTGSAGFQYTDVLAINDAGCVVGSTRRIAGVNTTLAQDAWYYDPTTHTTTAVIVSVRTSDAMSNSVPTVLTSDGYLLGTYTYFANGVGPGETRAFAYRPDVGVADLGELVSGGLAANGWTAVRAPRLAQTRDLIVGWGQTLGEFGESALVMTRSPACAACPADYDQDGGVTGGDIGAFFADFETGAACADVDQDGGITGSDLGAFFALYEAGGC